MHDPASPVCKASSDAPTLVQHPAFEPFARDLWIMRTRRHPQPRLRLYCFGYACGGASAFETWSERLDARIEVCRLQLPARENRRDEPPIVRLDTVFRLFDDIVQQSDAVPFAFFGYCMGARIAVAVARHLRRQQRAVPKVMFVAATPEPGCTPPQAIPTYRLSDEAMLEFAARFSEVPAYIFEEPQRLRRFLSLLRADLELNETIAFAQEEPFACPLTVFGGRQDAVVRVEQLVPWKDHSTGPFTMQLFDGPHMFLDTYSDAILTQVGAQLAPLL